MLGEKGIHCAAVSGFAFQHGQESIDVSRARQTQMEAPSNTYRAAKYWLKYGCDVGGWVGVLVGWSCLCCHEEQQQASEADTGSR